MRILSWAGQIVTSLVRRAIRLALFAVVAGVVLLVLDVVLLRDKDREGGRR